MFGEFEASTFLSDDEIGEAGVVILHQGGPTSSFPQAKNSFSVGPKGKETHPDTIFEK